MRLGWEIISTGGTAGALVEAGVQAEVPAEHQRRLRELFDRHYDFVWRLARRLGAPAEAADDAAQQVFIVAHNKLDRIEHGKERAFLFGTAARVTANLRRRSQPPRASTSPEATADAGPDPEERLEHARRRQVLDGILDSLGEDARGVLVLHELEGLTMLEIAELLQVPPGTVASRLRRARAQFERAVSRYQASAARGGA